jgi:hypothetical protein
MEDQHMSMETERKANGGTADPLRLAQVVVPAVDQIGAAAAREIEEAAVGLVAGAEEIAARLRELAEALRIHTTTAQQHVSEYVHKATTVLEGVRGLQEKIASGGEK